MSKRKSENLSNLRIYNLSLLKNCQEHEHFCLMFGKKKKKSTQFSNLALANPARIRTRALQ